MDTREYRALIELPNNPTGNSTRQLHMLHSIGKSSLSPDNQTKKNTFSILFLLVLAFAVHCFEFFLGLLVLFVFTFPVYLRAMVK